MFKLMKFNFKSILAAAAGILALSSCVEDAVAPLEGKYEKPATYELNTLVSQSVEKGEKTRTFTVEVGNTNNTLSMKLVGDKYFLADGSYTPSPADQAKKNMYIVGNGGTTFNNIPVESGSIKIVQGEGSYDFSGILWLADESIVDFKSTVALAYEPDPEAIKLTQVLSATSNVASGTNSVTLQLATDGLSSELDPNTWQTVWNGEGNYLGVDFYSTDGYLYPGVYRPSATGGVIAEGEYGIGWDPGDLWGIGMVFENWGTCWWTVSGGVATAEKINAGDIIVEKSGAKYTITYNHNGLWMSFSGKIEALDPNAGSGEVGDDTEYVELTTLLSATSNVANGTKSLTINMAEDGISSTTDPTTWQTVWDGEGHYLAMDIYSEDGKLYTGTYNACATGGTINAGEFGIGWDPGDLWGIGMVFENWGTCWWNVSGGAAAAEAKVIDGTVEVAVEGDNLVIKLKSSAVNAKFTCPVAEFGIEVVNLGGGNTEPDVPSVEYVELTTLLSATSNVANGTNSVTINMAQDGISSTMDPNTWQTVWEGEGYYLALDVYSEDGKLAPGTYTACAAGGQIGAGEFGIGWDPGDLWGIGMVFENWGTCWWAVANGTTTAEKVLDGTLTVEVDGDTYTISLQSSTVNAQYVGTLTL